MFRFCSPRVVVTIVLPHYKPIFIKKTTAQVCMTQAYERLMALTKDKHVHIATHWDCDGVSSGALLYHIVKENAAKVTTISKGEEFLIYPSDCPPEADIIICSDIQPSMELDPNKTIYIDHHPLESTNHLLMTIHDIEIQSCSLLIWSKLIPETSNSYFIFLTLLGFFGDSGDVDDLPAELQLRAKAIFPDMMIKKPSMYGGKPYVHLQTFVSMFNTGKRMHWNGMVPLELLKAVDDYKAITTNKHPLVDELQRYKLELRSHYNRKVDFTETDKIKYAIIECDKNIQGVICARYMKDKPIIVINKYNGNGIASMRVPDDLAFDAGAFLASFKDVVPEIIGGGHEKAGGITFKMNYLDTFLDFLEKH